MLHTVLFFFFLNFTIKSAVVNRIISLVLSYAHIYYLTLFHNICANLSLG
jgi:hypothetical protein